MNALEVEETSGVDFHGVTLGWPSEGPVAEALSELFAGFPRSRGRPELSIDLEVADVVTTSAGPDFEPWFFHGEVQTYRVPSGAWVVGGALRVRVTSSRVVGVVERAALFERRPLTMAAVRIAVLIALRPRGFFDLHAAAVRSPRGRGMLLVGDSGAGKTTLTLAFAAAGFDYVGDDTVLLHRSPRIAALRLPRPFSAARATIDAFEMLRDRPLARLHGGEKWELDVAASLGRRPSDRIDPSVIILPRVVDSARTEVRSVARAEVFAALLSSSALVAVAGMPSPAEQLELLRELADGCDVHEVLLGRDLLEAPTETACALAALVE